MSEVSDRPTFNLELPRHLRELSLLVGQPVSRADLLSLEETRNLRTRATQVARQPVAKFEIPFEGMKEPRFATFLERLAEANSSGVYLWTPASNACGLLKPTPLANFRPFPFDLNPEGILSIVTSDLHDQLLLDYSSGEENEQLLEVEASGEHWGRVRY